MNTACITFALISSACFGLALIVTQFGLRHVPAVAGAFIAIPCMTVLFWVLCPVFLDIGEWHLKAGVIFAVVGLFFPAVVTLLTYEANQRIGPMAAGAVGSTAPLFAAAIAVLFLGERLSVLGTLAILAILAGIVVIGWQPGKPAQRWPSRLLLLPLTAAALRGLAHALIKLGLMLWPSAFAASLIGYTVSTAVVAGGARLKLGTLRPRLNAKGMLWFSLVGLCNGLAVLTMYAALNYGPVTVVSPIVATYPLFTLVFGTVLLPRHGLTRQAGAGVVLTVAGVVGLLVAR